MPEDLARGEIDELGPSSAPEDIAVGGLVLVAPMMVSGVLGLDVHEHFAGVQVTLRGEVRAPRGPPFTLRPPLPWLEAAQPERSAGNERVPNVAE